MIMNNISILKSNKINVKAKYKLISFEKKSVEIQTFNSLVSLDKNLVSFVFFIKKKRPDYDILKQEEGKPFDIFDFEYSLGFFSGCSHFSFRVNFKEYKSGLKAAKFSLLLNQFCLKLERFIEIVNEILINNFCIDFYEDFFGDYLVDFDLKIHFLVILRTYSKVNTTTKFFIVPKGCFLGHLREYIWFSLFTDSLFLYTVSTYYKGFKKYLGVIFLLLIFYVYKLIHIKLFKLINKYKVYDYEERAFESLGNALILNNNSFNLYCKSNFKILKYSYFFSSRCLEFFMENEEEVDFDYKFLTKNLNFDLNNYFDLVTLDDDFLVLND